MTSKSVLKRLEKVEQEVAQLRQDSIPTVPATKRDLEMIRLFEKQKAEGTLISGEEMNRRLKARGVHVGRRVR